MTAGTMDDKKAAGADKAGKQPAKNQSKIWSFFTTTTTIKKPEPSNILRKSNAENKPAATRAPTTTTSSTGNSQEDSSKKLVKGTAPMQAKKSPAPTKETKETKETKTVNDVKESKEPQKVKETMQTPVAAKQQASAKKEKETPKSSAAAVSKSLENAEKDNTEEKEKKKGEGKGEGEGEEEEQMTAVRRTRKRICYVLSSDEETEEAPKKKPTTKSKAGGNDSDYEPDRMEVEEAAKEEVEADLAAMDVEEEEEETPSSKRSTQKTPASKKPTQAATMSDFRSAFSGSSALKGKARQPASAARGKRANTAPDVSPPKRARQEDESDKEDESPRGKKDEQRHEWLVDIKDADRRRPGEPDYDPNTLYIPPEAWKKFTPFEKQYWEVKSKQWDAIVFFRKGKFYELYEKDADIGNKEFDLKMTPRVNMKMVGVPEKSFTTWAAKFIGLGYKVAKVDEKESMLEKTMRERNNKSADKDKKIIERTLTTVLTAGTLSGDFVVDDAATYLMGVKEDTHTHHFGVVFVDASTGEFNLVDFTDDSNLTMFETLLVQIRPKELVLEKNHLSPVALRIIKNSLSHPIINQIEFPSLAGAVDDITRGNYFADGSESEATKKGKESWPSVLSDYSNNEDVMVAMGGLLSYLKSLMIDRQLLSHCNFRKYDPLKHGHCMIMDGQTLQNLDILQNGSAGTEGTLLSLLCQCQTPFGKRLFRKWICHPLRSAEEIYDRLDAGEDLHGVLQIGDLGLDRLPDLERLVSRIHRGTISVTDFLLTLKSFKKIHANITKLADRTDELKSIRLKKLLTLSTEGGLFPDLSSAISEMEDYFDWKAAADGDITIQQGHNTEYDDAARAVASLEEDLNQVLKQARATLKGRSDSVQFKHIGNEKYQLEVSSSATVPDNWTLKSQTKSVKRYWTPQLAKLVAAAAEAQVTLNQIKSKAYSMTLAKCDEHYEQWSLAVRCLSELDCLASLALAGRSLGEPMCRPDFIESDTPVLDLKDARHPCLSNGSMGSYIPNDTVLGGEGRTVMLLTGPNMGGKSTLLRQTCIAVIMAQLGCLVPAEACRMTLIDRIFTRIGANDNILAGQSTFMVELKETSNVLRHATKNSLVILDELGRGTSTFDGYAIAYAVVRHMIDSVGCLTFFSTHYHMLCNEFAASLAVCLSHMDCVTDEKRREVTFLYKLVEGVCPKSYGMNVAVMAGVPHDVVDRAEEKSEEFLASSTASTLPKHCISFQAVERILRAGDGNALRQVVFVSSN